ASVSSALTTDVSAVRGYTRPNGQHAIVYGNQTIRRHTGTPPGTGVVLGGNIPGGASPWGYTRANDPSHLDAAIYVDPNRNVHELTSVDDANFATLFAAPA